MNQIVVSVFSIEDSVVTDVVGPFVDLVSALNWITQEAREEMKLNPSYILDSNDEITIVCPENENLAEGFVYQVMNLCLPTTPVQEVPANVI